VRSQSVIVGNLSDEVQNSIEDRYLPGDDEDDLGKKSVSHIGCRGGLRKK